MLTDEEKQQRFDNDVVGDGVGNGDGDSDDSDIDGQVQECAQEEGRAGERGKG